MAKIVETYVFTLATAPAHGAHEHVPFAPEGLWVEELSRKRIAKDKQRLRPFHAQYRTLLYLLASMGAQVPLENDTDRYVAFRVADNGVLRRIELEAVVLRESIRDKDHASVKVNFLPPKSTDVTDAHSDKQYP